MIPTIRIRHLLRRKHLPLLDFGSSTIRYLPGVGWHLVRTRKQRAVASVMFNGFSVDLEQPDYFIPALFCLFLQNLQRALNDFELNVLFLSIYVSPSLSPAFFEKSGWCLR